MNRGVHIRCGGHWGAFGRRAGCLSVLMLVGVVFQPALSNPLQLEQIGDIRSLNNEKAAEGQWVNIEGQVFHYHPELARLFVGDGVSGVYVQLEEPAGTIEGLQVGSHVRVRGVTGYGGFSPIVLADEVRVNRWSELSDAVEFEKEPDWNTAFDVEWVRLYGKPVRIERVERYPYLMVLIERDSSDIRIYLPDTEKLEEKMRNYMFQEVSVEGVLATKANSQFQMTGRILYVNDLSDIRLVSPQFPQQPKLVEMGRLLQYRGNEGGLVRVQGVVTYVGPTVLYMQDEASSLRVEFSGLFACQPGDRVELAGYAQSASVSPSFRAVTWKILGKETQPLPLTIDLDDEIKTDWNYGWVSLDATLIDTRITIGRRQVGPDRVSEEPQIQRALWCRSGSHVFEARLPDGVTISPLIRAGSQVRLTGICHVTVNEDPRLFEMVQGIWLEVPDSHSVELIKAASWWTPPRLLWGLGFTVLVILFSIGWVVSLRETSKKQARMIGEQVKREARLNERQRIARELHDTLEQGLTALDLQLKRAGRKVQDSQEDSLLALSQAERMLEICRSESRSSIKELRGGMLEELSLVEAVRLTMSQLMESSGIEMEMKVKGKERALTLFAKHQLHRLISEALTNAVQHAKPERIEVSLHYRLTELEVLVLDDGCGFDPVEVEAKNRYGIQGMYERANRLHSELHIQSHQNRGTDIQLYVSIDQFAKEDAL